MSENNYIIVRDFDSTLREGDVLDEARARQWEPAGVLLLPVHAPHLPQRGGVGSLASTAYQRHVYGRGVLFDGARFAKGCPAPVCMPSSTARIEWMARVDLDGAAFSEPRSFGSVRLVGEESAHGHLIVTESTTSTLLDGHFRGSATVNGVERCFGAVCLAGACVGVRVLWLALTVLPR